MSSLCAVKNTPSLVAFRSSVKKRWGRGFHVCYLFHLRGGYFSCFVGEDLRVFGFQT